MDTLNDDMRVTVTTTGRGGVGGLLPPLCVTAHGRAGQCGGADAGCVSAQCCVHTWPCLMSDQDQGSEYANNIHQSNLVARP